MNRSGLSLRVMGCFGLLGCAAMAQARNLPAPPRAVEGLGMPVSAARLAAVRGGFDLGDGLQVSFGIQRAVYVDGNLVTYISMSIPDVAHITTQQAMSLATALSTVDVQIGSGNTFDPSSNTGHAGTAATIASGLALAGTQASVPATAPASGSALVSGTSILANGQMASAASSSMQAGAAIGAPTASGNPVVTSIVIPSSATQPNAATVIQNTVNNQVVRTLTTLNVAVNALNVMRGQNLQQSLQAAQQLQALSH